MNRETWNMGKNRKWEILFILFFLVSLTVSLSAQAEEGVVTAVYDGDTIKVRFDKGNSEVVRLIGINSPELTDSREKVRFIAFMAKRFSYSILYGQKVKLSYDWEKRDKFGRLLAYVFYNSKLFNEFILSRGFAYVFLKYPFREDYRQRFVTAYRNARKAEAGLWKKQPYPVIVPEKCKNHIGDLMRVRFFCADIQQKGKLIFLGALEQGFSAIINIRDKHHFSDIQNLKGRVITVTGFVEEYRGSLQVVLFMPSQIT